MQHALDLEQQATIPFDPELLVELDTLLNEKYAAQLDKGEHIRTSAFYGDAGTVLKAEIGSVQKAHVFQLVCSADLSLLVDYLDGVLEEFFADKGGKWLPIDYTKKTFDGHMLWIKHNYVHFALEHEADALLNKKSVK